MMMQTKKARIAVTMPRFSRYGGAESFAWRLSEALAARGHEVDFICGRCENEPPNGVTPIVVGRFGGTRLIKTLWFVWRAGIKQRQGKYDVVFGMSNTPNQDILRIGGGPISAFWQLSQFAWSEGSSRSCKMLRRYLSPVNWVLHWLDDARMKRTPRIVAVSHFVRDLIVKAHPHRKAESIDIVYNRPNLSLFAPPLEEERRTLREAAGISAETVVIGTAATNFALKGVRQLIQALAGLPENHVLHVAGGRKPGKYLRLAHDLGVGHRVHFLGKVDDMPSFYKRLDVFVLATFYDACSNAVLEALACGCRVTSSALNGSAYFLPAKWVFPDPADVSAMTDMLYRIAQEPWPEPFSWPTETVCGIEPFIAMIEESISE